MCAIFMDNKVNARMKLMVFDSVDADGNGVDNDAGDDDCLDDADSDDGDSKGHDDSNDAGTERTEQIEWRQLDRSGR